ncbi:pseudouridine synthase [Roseateles sp.]|uniref:pseudouridine synthase n=1 Tax=Roseateles sp. TaxID=1971397 RepID=UPI0025EDC652|nr:pseudouridine synthase [Roseateles sp.]MBV8033565.1 pseudouridine synthase [Roseateles sp.]
MNDADQDNPLPPAADAEAPAAPKRRRTTAKATGDAAPEAAAAEAAVPVKRTRRKAEAVAEEAGTVPEAAAAEEAPTPARKRAPRKTAAAVSVVAPAEEAVVEAVAAPAPVGEPEPLFTLGDEAPAAEQGGGEAEDEEGDDGERGGRSRNRRRNRKERAERQSAVQAAGGSELPGQGLAPELVEAAGARFADVLSGSLDAESEAPDAEPPVLAAAPDAAPEAEEAAGEGEGEAKRVLAPDADAPKLQKVLAQAGIGSRRDIEEWIADGKIEVNGEVAHVGQRISFGDQVRVNGKPVRVRISPPNPRILAYHKPTGEVSTFNDPEGRPTVFRTLPRVQGQKWQSVGRLDINTEGLLLFTNSGELANQLMHPRFGVEREYAARVLGSLSDEQRAKLLEGVGVDGQTASFKSIEDGGGEGANRWYRVVITEGRNREVRKLFEAVGMVVSRLIRIRYGTVVLPRGLKRGVWVELGDDDVRVIRRLAGHTGSGQGQSQQQGQQQGQPQQQGQGNKKDRNKRRSDDRHSGVGPRPSRPPEAQQQRPPREERAQRRDDDDEDDDFIPHHINPLEQTFDRRHATGGKRGIPQGFGAGGSGQQGGNRPGKGGNKGGGGQREPDPMQTSVGYIGGDAFLRRGGGGGGRGGKGGGGGRSGGGFGGRHR